MRQTVGSVNHFVWCLYFHSFNYHFLHQMAVESNKICREKNWVISHYLKPNKTFISEWKQKQIHSKIWSFHDSEDSSRCLLQDEGWRHLGPLKMMVSYHNTTWCHNPDDLNWNRRWLDLIRWLLLKHCAFYVTRWHHNTEDHDFIFITVKTSHLARELDVIHNILGYWESRWRNGVIWWVGLIRFQEN